MAIRDTVLLERGNDTMHRPSTPRPSAAAVAATLAGRTAVELLSVDLVAELGK